MMMFPIHNEFRRNSLVGSQLHARSIAQIAPIRQSLVLEGSVEWNQTERNTNKLHDIVEPALSLFRTSYCCTKIEVHSTSTMNWCQLIQKCFLCNLLDHERISHDNGFRKKSLAHSQFRSHSIENIAVLLSLGPLLLEHSNGIKQKQQRARNSDAQPTG